MRRRHKLLTIIGVILLSISPGVLWIGWFEISGRMTNAVESDNIAMVRKLLLVAPWLLENSDPGREVSNATPLVLAIESGNLPMVEFLLKRGANPSAKGRGLTTPLHHAAREGSVRILDLLLARGADVHATDANGETPLHWAACGGTPQIIGRLLSKGADPKIRDKEGTSPWDMAIILGHREAHEILMLRGAGGHYGLHEAASVGDLETVENELQRNPELVNRRGLKGTFPLHLAAQNGYPAVVRLLLLNGAEIDAEWEGESALNTAVFNDRLNVVQELVAQGADVNHEGEYMSPLSQAANFADLAMVKYLVAHGADVNPGDHKPLHAAVSHSRDDIVAFLLANDTDATAKEDGKTPLELAEESHENAIAQVIWDHLRQANPNRK